ncbi:MAG: hypothetical protein ACJ72N_07105 [Labedaea sp.]
MAGSTVNKADKTRHRMPVPLRSRLTLVVVPGSMLTVVCMFLAVLEQRLAVALMWFRNGLTVASVFTCLTVVVVVLDKHRWSQDAFSRAIAEAVMARNQVATATMRFERELAKARADTQRQVDEMMQELAANTAMRAVREWPHGQSRLSVYSRDTWRKEDS